MKTPTEALKEIRDRLIYFCLRTDGRYDPPWVTELVGIIDEAATGSYAVGNAAAMREALKMALDALKSADKYVYGDQPNGEALGWDDMWPSEWHNAQEAVEAALALPPRQCDVGTADEQNDRFLDFCSEYHDTGCYDCDGNPLCPVAGESDCKLAWAQTPYEAEEGGAE